MNKAYFAPVILLLILNPAWAGIVTFDGLTGSNLDPFASYTEAGFTVTAGAGDWFEGFNFGNPVPDLFAGPAWGATPDTIQVTGGLFVFGGFDLASNGGTTGYTISGFVGGLLVLSQSGAQTATPNSFVTIPSADSGAVLDTLSIVLAPNEPSPTSYNIDNINVTAIPEPATLPWVAAGLLGAMAMHSPRARALHLRRRDP
jgi:hypothetical protein